MSYVPRTDELRLTRKEWNIVSRQCRKCKLWSGTEGCTYKGAASKEPVLHCRMSPEYSDGLTRGG